MFVVEQIFKLRAKGHTNAQIGKALHIPEDYVTKIFVGRWPLTTACKEVADRLRNSLAGAQPQKPRHDARGRIVGGMDRR